MGKGQGFIQPAKLNLNLARIRKGGERFEIVIDPDAAILYKTKKLDDINKVLKSENVFNDSNKGFFASEGRMKELFGTSNSLEVAKIILEEGEIDLTKEYREKLQEQKRKKIIEIIHINSIDPRSNLPHPKIRIENAFIEAKITLDNFTSAEEQVDEIVKKLRPILPLKIAVLNLDLVIPSQSAHSAYGLLRKYGKIKKESWGSDGSLFVNLELPAGLQEEFLDNLNNVTKGCVDMKINE